MNWAKRKINIKNPAEIEIMREAGRINATVHEAVRELLEPGVTTADLNAVAEEVLRKHNATSPFKNYPGPYPFPASITVCINEELVHGIPSSKRKLKEGDLVSIDCGTFFGGFVADSAFSAGVGKLSQKAERLDKVTKGALKAGIDKMLPGNKTGDISAAIQKYVESRGFYLTREYTGHGVGRKMHEAPQVPNYGIAGRGVQLRPGMTIALEPMVLAGTARTKVLADQWTVISADRSLTAHHEHTIAVTEGNPLILTVL
ncbi:MAG TPA: type I methionyl aminopeptidase [Anaerolineales bacterium]|nr:type I methionyl aminopeptidase [Anaerolineales bacterium]